MCIAVALTNKIALEGSKGAGCFAFRVAGRCFLLGLLNRLYLCLPLDSLSLSLSLCARYDSESMYSRPCLAGESLLLEARGMKRKGLAAWKRSLQLARPLGRAPLDLGLGVSFKDQDEI